MMMDVDQVKSGVRQLQHTVYGNGAPGLDEVVRRIESNQKVVQGELKSMREEIATFHTWLRTSMVTIIKWCVAVGTPIVVGAVLHAIATGAL